MCVYVCVYPWILPLIAVILISPLRSCRSNRYREKRENRFSFRSRKRGRPDSKATDAVSRRWKNKLTLRRLCERQMHTESACVSSYTLYTVTVDFPWECARSVPRNDQGFALPIRALELLEKGAARSAARSFERGFFPPILFPASVARNLSSIARSIRSRSRARERNGEQQRGLRAAILQERVRIARVRAAIHNT